jgi:hypothetical protein
VGGSAAHQMWCGAILRYYSPLPHPEFVYISCPIRTLGPSKWPKLSFRPTPCSPRTFPYLSVLATLESHLCVCRENHPNLPTMANSFRRG